MKYMKWFTIIIVLSLVFTVSCQTVRSSDDYYAGRAAAEEYAQKDAIKLRCSHYPAGTKGKYLRNLNKYLDEFKKSESESFLKGFESNYKDFFVRYMDLYCGF